MKPMNNLTTVAIQTGNDNKHLKRIMPQKDYAKVVKLYLVWHLLHKKLFMSCLVELTKITIFFAAHFSLAFAAQKIAQVLPC